MNISRTIHLMTVFIILWIFVMMIRPFIMHNLGPSAFNEGFRQGINGIVSAGWVIFGWVILIIIILWITWKIINKIVPKFFRKLIRWPWSPWKEFDRGPASFWESP